MTKRVVISLAAIGILFLLTAYAQRSQIHPTQQLTVYDSEGRKVGGVAGVQSTYGQFLPVVAFKVDGVTFMLNAFRDGFLGQGTIVWESNDCSGTPLITLDSPATVSPPSSIITVGVGLPASTVYVENGAPRTITVHSFSTSAVPGLDKRFPQPARCVTANFVPPWTMVCVPARALVDMNTLYTAPFTVR